MNKETLFDTYKPISALVVYESRGDYYIESHDIDESGNMGGATPLSVAFVKKLATVFSDKGQTQYSNKLELMPSNLLVHNDNPYNKILAWRSGQKNTEINIGNESYKLTLPPMIFVVHNETLYVYCCKGDYELYKAPFYNVYQNNKVCMGDVEIPKEFESISKEMEWWERAFFGSKFTHALDNDGRATIPLNEIWKSEGTTAYKFLEDYLISLNTTLLKQLKTL